jgi:hypothetical protein
MRQQSCSRDYFKGKMIWIDQNWMKEDQIHNFAKN